MIWTLAVRNVMRNRRRSVITVLSIAVGLAALALLVGRSAVGGPGPARVVGAG